MMNKSNITSKSVLILIICFITSCTYNNKNEINELNFKIDSLKKELKLALDVNKTLTTELKSISVKQFKNEDFNRFFWKFMTDSTFQFKRIIFPIKNVTWIDGPGGKIDTVMVKSSDWKYDSFYFNKASERTQIYDNVKLQFQPTNERVLHWYGVETGGDAKYYFKGVEGKWYLIQMEQLGD